MLIRTHLAITVLAVLVLLPFVNNKIIFVIISIIATFIPDIDSKYSTLGRKKVLRPAQVVMKHRGIWHSFTLLIILTGIIIYFYSVAALPFFLGYSFHLLADSFTIEGIRPFYPSKKTVNGKIKTGSHFEKVLLIILVGINLILFLIEIQRYI